MLTIERVPISGNRARPSLFGTSVHRTSSFHPTLARSASLGQVSPGDWYNRATSAMSQYQQLYGRLAYISNDAERARILSFLGDPAKSDSPAYRYLAVNADATAAARTGTLDPYSNPNVTDRVAALEDSVKQFDSMVTSAETAFGKLAQPVSLQNPTAPAAAATAPTNYTTPILMGAGIIALGLVAVHLSGRSG